MKSVIKKIKKEQMLNEFSGYTYDAIKDLYEEIIHISFIDCPEEREKLEKLNKTVDYTHNIHRKILDMINMIQAEEEPIKDQPIESKTIGTSKFTMPFSINELELTIRQENALKFSNIYSIGELLAKTEYDLKQLNGIGKETVSKIKEALSNYGLKLKKDICQ